MITVLGGRGFVGSHLVRRVEALGLDYQAPERLVELGGRELGVVINCTGVTADFRHRLLDTVEAHVCLVERLLRESCLESLTYLSSTRLYRGISPPAREDDVLAVDPAREDELYNLSKAMGESLTLHADSRSQVVRIANIYGPGMRSDDFLSEVLREVVTTGELTLRTSLESARDYVRVDDVVTALIDIATAGRQRVYNLASGHNVSHGALAARLVELTGCRVEVLPGAPTVSFPEISVERLREEFVFEPASVLDDLPALLEDFSS